MPLTHTRLAWVGRSLSRSKFGTHRRSWVGSVTRGAKALGCTARRLYWRRSMAAQVRALGLAIYTVVFFPQFDRQAPGDVAAFVVVEYGEYLRFSGRTAPAVEACRQA